VSRPTLAYNYAALRRDRPEITFHSQIAAFPKTVRTPHRFLSTHFARSLCDETPRGGGWKAMDSPRLNALVRSAAANISRMMTDSGAIHFANASSDTSPSSPASLYMVHSMLTRSRPRLTRKILKVGRNTRGSERGTREWGRKFGKVRFHEGGKA